MASSLERLVDLADQAAAGHRADDVLRHPPAELLGDLEADRLRALGVERPQVDVHEAPAVLERDLRAEAVDLVVGAVDADDLGPVDAGAEDLGPLQVGRARRCTLSSPAAAALAATLLARLPVEAQPTVVKPNSRALLRATETTRSLNDSVGKLTASFLIQSCLDAQRLGQAVGPDQRRAADLRADGRLAVERQQLAVAPHVAAAAARSCRG